LTVGYLPGLFAGIMVFLVYVGLCLVWGSAWLAIKVGLEDSPPFWSAGLRFVIAGGVLFLINTLRGAKYPREWSEIGRIALPGIFMYGFSYMAVYWAEVYIDSSLTAVLFASMPFFIAGFSVVMLKDEKLGLPGWIGLVIGFIGIIGVFYDSLLASQFALLGVVMVLLGSAAAGYATVYIRARLQQHSPWVMTGIQMPVGAVIIIPAAVIFESLSDFKVTPKSISALLYLSIFGTVIAFLGYYWLLKKLRAIAVAQIAFIMPVIAIILGYLFLSEVLSVLAVISSVLILLGVMLVLRK
jgi:drug/metabolite transporter (DMT)-like permease